MKRAKPVLLFEKLQAWGVDYCCIDTVLPDGMVRDQKDVDPMVGYFMTQNIDALFIPYCNFGTEGAAGMIAKGSCVPALLWGPRDEAPLPDGSRLRDSLCGTLATSKVLHTPKVPFHFKLKDGPLTLCRFDVDGESYRLSCGEGHTVAGSYTQEFYAWMEVDNWPQWEEQLTKEPYIHHCSCIYDHCADIMAETTAMIPDLEFEYFGR